MSALPNPFITDNEHRFVLDEKAFMAAIEPAPAFLSDPTREYLMATEISPIVDVLACHMEFAR